MTMRGSQCESCGVTHGVIHPEECIGCNGNGYQNGYEDDTHYPNGELKPDPNPYNYPECGG